MKTKKILLSILSLLLINPLYSQQVQRPVRKQPAAARRQPVRRQQIRRRPAAAPRKQPAKAQQQPQKPAKPAPINKAQEPKAPQVTAKYGMATAQNKRPYQEDRFDSRKIIGLEQGDFFGIYDGHGGDKTSSFLQKNLATYFGESILRKPSVQDAFERAFFRADFHALDQFTDGSTAITLFIDEKNILHCAWAGDSRAVVEKNGTVGFATEDHKPDSKKELDRIEKAGGTIQKHGVWRVNGLAISRSIGDRPLKDMGKGQIIATPEYAQVQLRPDNHFLILASDGLWDVFDNQAVVDFVKNKLITTSDLNAIATALQNDAIKKGSEDNITICIVMLDIKKQVQLAKKQAPVKKQEVLKKPANTSYLARFWNWLRGRK